VCYGYDRNRRMLMNFGPINQRGGEKRLNVIVSRAKEHMAIISSIRYSDIKNEYNDGANNLRLFLQYAESFSRGEWENARRILTNLNPQAKKVLTRGPDRNVVAEQVAEGLRQRGWTVDAGVGQSRFRCDLAVRDSETPGYGLGLFIDSEDRIASAHLMERAVFQPRVLQSFGWRFAHVLTKDWFHDPQAVLDRLERRLKEMEPEVVPVPAPTPSVEPVELKASPIAENLLVSEEPVAAEPSGTFPAELSSEPVPPVSAEPSPEASLPVFHEINVVDNRPYLFELRDTKSHKFWEITINQKEFTTCYGRVGSTGQSQTKSWASDQICKRESVKLIRDKIRKGYQAAIAG
jgi:predicted DNA-binding WGR domain protein